MQRYFLKVKTSVKAQKFCFLRTFGMEIQDQCTNKNNSGGTKIHCKFKLSLLAQFKVYFSFCTILRRWLKLRLRCLTPGQILHFDIFYFFFKLTSPYNNFMFFLHDFLFWWQLFDKAITFKEELIFWRCFKHFWYAFIFVTQL